MHLKITYPDDFPLHGLDRDMFETRLRKALRFCFYGNTVRQLAEQVDARHARVVPDALPLRRIADQHAFEDYMARAGSRIDDMSAPLRRNLLRNVGVRTGQTISAWGYNRLLVLDGSDSHVASHAIEVYATNRQSRTTLSGPNRQAPRASNIWLAAGLLCADTTTGGAGWTLTRPVAPLNATVVSASPAQTLRKLASSVPEDRRLYRVSVQIEPQDTGTTPR